MLLLLLLIIVIYNVYENTNKHGGGIFIFLNVYFIYNLLRNFHLIFECMRGASSCI